MGLHQVVSQIRRLLPPKATIRALHTNKAESVVPADRAGILRWLTSLILDTEKPPKHGALVLFRMNSELGEFEPDTVVDISYALDPQWFAQLCADVLCDSDVEAQNKLLMQLKLLHQKALRKSVGYYIGPYFMETGPQPDWEMVNWIWAYLHDLEKIRILTGEKQ